VNPDHLFLGTIADNIADMVAKGRGLRGDQCPAKAHPERLPHCDRHPAAVFTNAEVREMRAKHHSGVRIVDIAREVGAKYATVYMAVTGRNWRRLTSTAASDA
jgi:hypothetical protein